MQRGPRDHETRSHQFTIQRLGDSTHIPYLLGHAVLTLDTRSPTD